MLITIAFDYSLRLGFFLIIPVRQDKIQPSENDNAMEQL